MKLRTAAVIFVGLLLVGCGVPLATTSPTVDVPPAAGIEADAVRTVTFITEDGLTLSGTLCGSGSTAVIFSHMFPTDQTSWTHLAQELAARGYMALTYDFRGYGASEGEKDISQIDKDLRAAIAFARGEDATDVVLVGASMGGTATAKLAAVENPAAVVIMSAPTSFRGLTVSDDELRAISAPKLFIGSEKDGATPFTLHMFEETPEPKEKHVYPGGEHGTFIFDSEHGDDLKQRIIQFIETNTR